MLHKEVKKQKKFLLKIKRI